MKQLRQSFAFLVYSNLFIAACAVLMVYQTGRLLLEADPPFVLTGFIFSSTLCSYSFHYYLTFHSEIPSERIEWLKRNRFVHVILFFAGLAGVVYFGYRLLSFWPWLLIAALATFLYSAPKIPHPLFRSLRKVAIGKTIFLAFIWMYVTTLLPAIVEGRGGSNDLVLFAVSRFFFIYAVCILFDYRDRQDDKAAGIRSLITYMNDKSISILYYASLAVYALCTLAMLFYGYEVFPLVLLLIPGLILSFSYNYARRHFSDLYYYFVLDGCLALSALLMLVAGI